MVTTVGRIHTGPLPDYIDFCGDCGAPYPRRELTEDYEGHLRCDDCLDDRTVTELHEAEAILVGDIPQPYVKGRDIP